jgi:hypothetical protein
LANCKYGLTSRYDRLRTPGLLTVEEIAALLRITPHHVKIWQRYGLIRGHAYSDKNECLYDHPGENPPYKAQGIKLSERRRIAHENVSKGANDVQYEA